METLSIFVMIAAVAVLLWMMGLMFALAFMYAVMNWIEK